MFSMVVLENDVISGAWWLVGFGNRIAFLFASTQKEHLNEGSLKPFIHAHWFLEEKHNPSVKRTQREPILGNTGPRLQNSS